jgi:hypothetical protein
MKVIYLTRRAERRRAKRSAKKENQNAALPRKSNDGIWVNTK